MAVCDPGDPASEIAEQLDAEQRHIDRAYDALDRLREGAAAGPSRGEGDDLAGGTFQERFERERITADARRRVGQLRWGDPPLVFGRIDLDDTDERFHIGRIGVFDEDNEQLVVDWRAPIAEGFYRATRAEPMGLRRRRSFHCRGRQLLGIDDVVLAGDGVAQGPVVGEAALLAALASPRTGRMQDAVATVQTEQDEVIRAPMAGITIVQGAAGTGKTVVALHRAAYLLYTFRDVLDRQGVLLLGPNARFLDYVRDVLPSLGEHEALLATPGDLFPGVRPVPEADIEVATVKARIEMARVLRRAVRMRQRHLREDAVIPFGRFRLRLGTAVVNNVVDTVRGLEGTHNARRRFVLDDLVGVATAEFHRRNVATSDRMRDPGPLGVRAVLLQTPEFRALLDRVWPLLAPEELLHDLLGSRAMLRHAGRRGLLDPSSVEALHRSRRRDVGEVAWTDADVPLLHEAHHLLGVRSRPVRVDTEPTEDEQFLLDRVMESVVRSTELGVDAVMEADLRQSVLDEIRVDLGTGVETPDAPDVPAVWGSVLVDEAQDLSPMAWRMVARTCPNQAMTIVGDLAQGTAPWSPTSWDQVVGWIGARHPAKRHDLHVNYRTPTEIMALAAPYGAHADQARAIRRTEVAPSAVVVSERHLPAAAAAQARALAAGLGDRRIGVVVDESLLETVRTLSGADIDVHTPETVKGLEFDAVVVVEPATLLAHPAGRARLYIALTRSTTHLVVVHAAELPEGLRSLAS